MNDLLRQLLFLPPQASSVARQIDNLHYFVISVTMASALLVSLVTFVFITRYTRRSEAQLTQHIEVGAGKEFTMIAGTLGLFLLWWVIGYRQYAAMQAPPPDAIPIYVIGKQWMWQFTYADGRSTNDVLVVPTRRPIKLLMTSRDVIHSFYVPAFRQKHDVLPNRYIAIWFEPREPGSYPIFCAEYCGVSHSLMRGTVLVLSDEEYRAWLDGDRRLETPDPYLSVRGKEVATRHACLACHRLDGLSHVGPTWKGLYGSTVVLEGGKVIVADDAYLTRSMMEPQAEVVAGYKPVMPTFQGLLDPGEVAALVQLIRSLRSTP